ncbi:DgyrCDS13675 [Dimorphilus gyrociliatus]|uniref:DgyrCDS13675 n=1 Tax=Dimorphilus gyrociliatus TaxID=2664684 RepID=A0A7I8WBD4_9ANNE|nr:DgyrCDS13675 [Dimorphilus gyrociliatus]
MNCLAIAKRKWNCKSFRGPFVCLLSVIVYSMTTANFFTFGEYIPALKGSITNQETYLGLISSTAIALVCLVTPIATFLSNRIGSRKCLLLGTIISSTFLGLSGLYENFWSVYICFGIIFGTVACLMINPLYFVVNLYYPFNHPRHVLANSLLTCGYPLGTFILNPILEALISHFGWQKTFGIQGLILFLICFPSAMAIVEPHQLNDDEYTLISEEITVPLISEIGKKKELKKVTRIVVGTCWFMATALRSIGYTAPIVLLVCS